MRILTLFAAMALFTLPTWADDPAISLTAKLNTPVVSMRGGTVYLHLAMGTPRIRDHRRQPLNLSVVVDRSGSMGDERKIDYARRALHRLIDALRPEDLFSLVIYDDAVKVLARPHRVTDRDRLHRMVDRITPGGSTNLGGGMIEGLQLARRSSDRERINRVILLSDGLANQGITSSSELNRIARQYRSEGVTLTAMGLGLDYNENLMVGLAESGGGNYYFIEHPDQMAHILAKEFDHMASIVCRNAVIELHVRGGSRMRDVIGSTWSERNGRIQIPVGDLLNDDRREIVLELDVPEGTGELAIVDGSLRYDSDQIPVRPASFAAAVTYTKDARRVEQLRDLETQAKADVAVSTREVSKALEVLDAGDADEAKANFQRAEQALVASPAAAASGAGGDAVRAQISRLRGFQDSVATGDTRKAKKSIQYQNYQVQKNK
ncbi:MAG: VWA domain-containing protein [Bacteroidetes bacterium]|jgi:Ca-activated chloride channel family protein|nr:VWA domain-containing protein [Bacteroidota bacterium]